MKKIILLVLAMFLFSGVAFSAPVSIETMKQVAVNWMSEKSMGRQDPARIVEYAGESVNGDKTYHVFNFDPDGWVIISADDAAFPVIGYSLTGTRSADNYPPNFSKWMDTVEKAIIAAGRERTASPAFIQDAWTWFNLPPEEFNSQNGRQSRSSTTPPIEGPLLGEIQWNQNQYYNESCPADVRGSGGHAYAGCVAAAMGQIMKYYAHPDQGVGSNSYSDPFNLDEFDNEISGSAYGVQSAEFGATTYNWAGMPDSISSSDADIAQVLYHCGVSVNMNFGPYGSSGSSVSAMNALKDHFKYKESAYFAKKLNYDSSEWENLLKAEITAGRPILYSGSGSGDHAFICDGFDSGNPVFFHFNWGWGGSYDGYYLLTSLTPDIDNYTQDQDAVLGIEPSVDPTLVYPYYEDFETGLPDEWLMSGDHAAISSAEAHSGAYSLRLGNPGVQFTDTNTGVLKINVPQNGAALSFWVKRGYDTGSSEWNSHYAVIRPQFGTDILSTIFDGNYNDTDWVQFIVDLSPWKNQVISLLFGQTNNSSWNEWIHIDDIQITESPMVDFTTETTEWFANRPLQFINLSANADSYSWTFTGTTSASSSLANPEIIYPNSGTFNVSLTGQNTVGSDTETKNSYITILPEPVIPYAHNFNADDGGFRPYVLSGSGGQWEWGSCNSSFFYGSLATIEGQAGWATVLDDYHGFSTRYALETPPFSLADADGEYSLEFKYRAACGDDAGMNIEYSTDGGNTWTILGDINDPNGTNWYDSVSVLGLNNSPGWIDSSFSSEVIESIYDITFLANKVDVRFRFVFGAVGSASDGFQVDEFTINYVPNALSSEIDIQGNGISISDGDEFPVASDNTDFGDVDTLAGEQVHTFTILNTGMGDLTISSPSITGTHEDDFTVTSPPNTLISPTGQTSFSITFDPGADGTRTATVTIINDDPDENPYTFRIQGAGTTTTAPEMEVRGNSILISDGDGTPSSTDNTDFGVIGIFDETRAFVFSIHNTGTGTLNLTAPDITGIHASDFYVTSFPVSTVSPGNQTTFEVTFDPSGAGDRTASIEIANDDADENPYNFKIKGIGKPFGDVQGDTDVDLNDAILTLKIVTGITVPSVNPNADIDGNGRIDLREAIYILRKVADL